VIDIEKVLTAYLKTETGERIVGETPTSTGSPWVKVTLLDTDDRSRPTDRLLRHFVQFDCYAGSDGPSGQGEAQALCDQVRAALRQLSVVDLPEGVVTSVEIRGPRRIPDLDFESARQRYILEVELCVHS